mmetsp:Transcript_2584/g.3764  ORF Transcript_2584/g.3764 Transcript_2584/m.3764 type:complete len:221 (+) Transcript_2584:159-821(+)
MFSMESEDDFSSDESSIDASQLLQETKPIHSQSKQKTHESNVTLPENANANEINQFGKESDPIIPVKEVGPVKDIKLVLGQSILDWQKCRKKGSTPKQQQAIPGVVVICHDEKIPFSPGSKLNIDSATAEITLPENDSVAYSGQRVEQGFSSPTVDCVAVYDPKKGSYVLEKVDWTSTLRRHTTGRKISDGTKKAQIKHGDTVVRSRSLVSRMNKRHKIG